LWLGFRALTGAATGSMIEATTGSEFWIGVSVWIIGVEESGVDELELGNPRLDKLVVKPT
nr:hypothetical protein [Tanacetum cinerariifolium]